MPSVRHPLFAGLSEREGRFTHPEKRHKKPCFTAETSLDADKRCRGGAKNGLQSAAVDVSYSASPGFPQGWVIEPSSQAHCVSTVSSYPLLSRQRVVHSVQFVLGRSVTRRISRSPRRLRDPQRTDLLRDYRFRTDHRMYVPTHRWQGSADPSGSRDPRSTISAVAHPGANTSIQKQPPSHIASEISVRPSDRSRNLRSPLREGLDV